MTRIVLVIAAFLAIAFGAGYLVGRLAAEVMN